MSELDKRVIEMQFDNAQFEKNVNQSMKTIDKLDEKLQFEDVSKSMQKVKVSFSALEIVMIAAISSITNSIVILGIQLIKSLSVDNISAGWNKFGEKTISVATMAAQKIRVAGVELTNYSDKMEAINNQLDKLNWFTDETSYNFTQMADTIGKFTAAGRDLDESVDAMMGIATWAALSGQNAFTASIAMTQLSQALGRGYIMTQDWRSIENARMATEEFKQTVLDTAVAMGEMTKEGQYYITKTGDKISSTDFDLSSKWFTSDILIQSLEKYSAAVQRIYEISSETGLTATEVMARYGDELDAFGLKAFRAAQEARTFNDAINAIKDAVSTGWLNTAEKIFGGYDESKVLWTELANELYDVFVEGGNFRNEILGMWSDLAGRSDIFGEHGTPTQGAFWNIYDSIIAVKDLIKETWNSIFSISDFSSYSDRVSDLADKIKSITERLQAFTKRIKDTITNSFELKAILSGIFSVVKVGIQIIYGLLYALDPVIQAIKNIISLLFNRIAAFAIKLTKVDGVIYSIQTVAQKISAILQDIIDFINPTGILDKFLKLISKIYNTIADTHPLEKAADAVKGFIDAFRGSGTSNLFTNIASGLSGLLGVFGSKVGNAGNLLDPLYAIMSGLSSFIKGMITILKPLITIAGQTLNFVGIVLEIIGNMLSKVINVFDSSEASKITQILVVIVSILGPLVVILVLIYNLFYSVHAILGPITYLLANISDSIYAIGQSFYMKAIAKILQSVAQVLLVLAISMSIIANIPSEGFARAAITLGIMSVLLVAIITALSLMTKGKTKLGTLVNHFRNLLIIGDIVAIIYSISFTLIAISLALKLIASIGSIGAIWNSVLVVFSILAALSLFVYYLTKFINNKVNYKKANNLFRSISGTLLIIGVALKVISSIDSYGDVWNSVIAIGAILFEFVYFIKALKTLINNDLNYKLASDTLRSISWTLLVMSATIKVLSSIKDYARISMSILAVGLILSLFVAFIAALNKLTKENVNYSAIIKSLNGISITLLAMTIAIKMLSSIDSSEKVFISVAAIISILLAFLGFIFVLNKIAREPTNYSQVVKIMTGIDVALIAITIALKQIASIGDYGQVWSSVGAITVILLAFLGFIFILSKIAKTGIQMLGILFIINGMAIALVGIGLAMMIAAKAMKNFNDVDWSSFGKLTVAFLIIRSLGKSGIIKTAKILMFSASLLVLSVGLIAFSAAMNAVSSIDWRSVGMLATVFGVLLGLTALLTILKSKLKVRFLSELGIALIPLSIGLIALSFAMSLFNNITWETMSKAAVAIAGSLLILGLAVKFLFNDAMSITNMVIISATLIILAAAIAAMALSLQLLQNISWQTMGKGAAMLAGAFIILGLAALILKPVIGTIALLSMSILMLGLGMLTASASLGLFATNLPLFLESIIGNITLIGEALTTIGPVLVTAMINAFKSLFDSLGELIPSIVNLVIELINGITTILRESAGPLIVTIIELIIKLVNAIADNTKPLFDGIFKIIKSLLKALSDNIKDIAQELIDIIIKIIDVVTKNVPTIIKSLIQFLVTLVNVLFDNIGPLIEVIVLRLFEFLGKVIPLFIKELIKFTSVLVSAVLVLIATVIKLVIISLGTLSKLFVDLVGGIILIVVHTFIGLTRVLYQAMRTILYNIFYVLFEILGNLPDDLLNLLGGALGALLGSIVKLMGNLINKYLGGLFGLGDILYEAGETMVNSAKNGISDSILKGDNVMNAMNEARNNISNVMDSVTDMISEDVNKGVSEITDVMKDGLDALANSTSAAAEKAGEQTGEGLVDGIENSTIDAYNSGQKLANAAITGVTDTAQIRSPSKVMEKMGQYFVEGLTTGIENKSEKAKKSVFSMMNDVLSGVQSVLDSDMDNEFTIRPIMDLSGVSSGAANISSLMNNINGGKVSVTGQFASNLSRRINKLGSLENQNGSKINDPINYEGDVYNATFNVISDNPEEIAKEVNVRLQKMHNQSRQAKGGV